MGKLSTEEINKAIRLELEGSKIKYPLWPVDSIHAAALIAEELGELQQACLDDTYKDLNHKPESTKVRQLREAIQTAAMAIRFIKNWPYETKPDQRIEVE